MKKFSIILNVILLLTIVFLVVYTRLKVSQVNMITVSYEQCQYESSKLVKYAEEAAASHLEAEAVAKKIQIALEECQKQNQ